MEIMELAAELGKMIKNDARVTRMNEAAAAYEANEALQAKIAEYNAQTAAMTEEYKKADKDGAVIESIEQRINELYDEITSDPTLVAYNETSEAVNALMNEVNGEITFQITGERPCTHDCSTCGSDCGHHH